MVTNLYEQKKKNIQKDFLPKKKFYESKVNWLFTIIGLTQIPEVNVVLSQVPLLVPTLSFLGVIARTYFTESIIEK